MPPPVVCQPYYNAMNRQPEVEILPACDYYGIGVVPYSPLARGVLTGKYAPGAQPPADSRVATQGPADHGDRVPRRVDRHGADDQGACREEKAARATQFALAWVLRNEIVSSVIAGPRTLEQWNDYLAALGTTLERRRRSADRLAGDARTSVDAGLQRSAVSVLRAHRRLAGWPLRVSRRRVVGDTVQFVG